MMVSCGKAAFAVEAGDSKMNNDLRGIILIGAPGAGKGTQAMFVSQRYNLPQISTGDILRSEIKDGSDIGNKAKSFITQGLLVPDEVVIKIVEKRLKAHDCKKGFILDGFPRTLPQAKAMIASDIEANLVLIIDVDDNVIMRRLSGRRTCSRCNKMYHIPLNPPAVDNTCDACGGALSTRKDDQPETIRKRITVFREQTSPLINFFECNESFRVFTIDGGEDDSETPEIIFQRIRKVLDEVFL